MVLYERCLGLLAAALDFGGNPTKQTHFLERKLSWNKLLPWLPPFSVSSCLSLCLPVR